MLREAGLTPVRRLRGAFGQRYAIAALPTAEGADAGWAARPDRGRGMTGAAERIEVAIVGGGPAGAALAARLASAGLEVVVFERSPAWHWRAGGVFASPAAVAALGRAGLAPAVLAEVARPIPAMRVEPPGGTAFRLTYGTETGGPPAVGFDRSRLDPLLLARAAAGRRRGPGRLDGHCDRAVGRPPRGARSGRTVARRSARRSWSVRTGRTRSWPVAPGSPGRSGSTRGSV